MVVRTCPAKVPGRCEPPVPDDAVAATFPARPKFSCRSGNTLCPDCKPPFATVYPHPVLLIFSLSLGASWHKLPRANEEKI